MAKTLSKNARTNVVTQKFFCPCGGEVKMQAVVKGGKIRYSAKCDKCGAEKRRPSDFK